MVIQPWLYNESLPRFAIWDTSHLWIMLQMYESALAYIRRRNLSQYFLFPSSLPTQHLFRVSLAHKAKYFYLGHWQRQQYFGQKRELHSCSKFNCQDSQDLRSTTTFNSAVFPTSKVSRINWKNICSSVLFRDRYGGLEHLIQYQGPVLGLQRLRNSLLIDTLLDQEHAS